MADEWPLFGVAIVMVDGKQTKDSGVGKKLEAAARLVRTSTFSIFTTLAKTTHRSDQCPTIFSLLYAAIAARSLRMLDRYLSHDGSNLGVSFT
jgi:hypothetical protein